MLQKKLSIQYSSYAIQSLCWPPRLRQPPERPLGYTFEICVEQVLTIHDD